jgi:predicted CXXCH cytochrome family protein
MRVSRLWVSRGVAGGLGAAVFLVSVFMPETGCAGKEARFHVLNFFFDGVPDPNTPVPAPGALPNGPLRPEDAQADLSVHSPYQQRKCELCHEGQHSNRLKMDKSLLCGSCHTGDQFEGKFIHGPVAMGDCQACHEPHRSTFPHLLRAKGSSVCGQCHTPQTFDGLEKHKAEKGEDCLDCHSPHASNQAHLLK